MLAIRRDAGKGGISAGSSKKSSAASTQKSDKELKKGLGLTLNTGLGSRSSTTSSDKSSRSSESNATDSRSNDKAPKSTKGKGDESISNQIEYWRIVPGRCNVFVALTLYFHYLYKHQGGQLGSLMLKQQLEINIGSTL